jgi:hypothetical protein
VDLTLVRALVIGLIIDTRLIPVALIVDTSRNREKMAIRQVSKPDQFARQPYAIWLRREGIDLI